MNTDTSAVKPTEPQVAPTATPAANTEAPKAKAVASAFFKSFGLDAPKDQAEQKPEAKPEPKPEAKPAKVDKPAEKPAEKTTEKPSEKPAEKPEAKPKGKSKSPIEQVFDEGRPEPLPKEDVDVKKLVREAVEGALEAKPKAEKPKEEKVELPRGISRRMEALRILEEEEPSYKGISKKVEDFYKPGGLKDRYRQNWERENPGKQFDDQDESHDDFFAKNDPLSKVAEEDLEYARDRLVEKRAEEIAERKISRKLESKSTEERRTQAKSAAKQAVDNFALETLASFSDEYAEKVKTPEKLRSLDEDDPIAEHVLVQVVNVTAPVIEAAHEVFSGVPFDEKNAAHIEMERQAIELQEKLLQMGSQARRDGRQFVPITQYGKLSAEDKARAWTIGMEDVVKYVRINASKVAKSTYAKLSGKKLVAKTQQQESKAKSGEEQESHGSSDSSPSVGASTVAPPPGKSLQPPIKKPGDSFFASMGVK
jgi:hypothetical protein